MPSLVTLAHIASHLQNCSRAHLTLTSIPSSHLNLSLSLALQQSGFLSSVTRAGTSPPLLLTPTTLQTPSTSPELLDPRHPDTPIIHSANIASRRLWLGLKYWKDKPVISKMEVESKPTRRVWVKLEELEGVVRGKRRGYVRPLTQMGECLFLSTEKGVLESREAVERGVGGMLLVRVS